MKRRLSEAGRYTVYYSPAGSTRAPAQSFEAEAPDRGSAIELLTKHLGTDEYVVLRVVPGWPERNKKGKQS